MTVQPTMMHLTSKQNQNTVKLLVHVSRSSWINQNPGSKASFNSCLVFQSQRAKLNTRNTQENWLMENKDHTGDSSHLSLLTEVCRNGDTVNELQICQPTCGRRVLLNLQNLNTKQTE